MKTTDRGDVPASMIHALITTMGLKVDDVTHIEINPPNPEHSKSGGTIVCRILVHNPDGSLKLGPLGPATSQVFRTVFRDRPTHTD